MSAINGERYQRRNDRRDAQPAPAERVRERPPPSPPGPCVLLSKVKYYIPAGTAKVQPTIKMLEALMRQVQSAMAHLKKDE